MTAWILGLIIGIGIASKMINLLDQRRAVHIVTDIHRGAHIKEGISNYSPAGNVSPKNDHHNMMEDTVEIGLLTLVRSLRSWPLLQIIVKPTI